MAAEAKVRYTSDSRDLETGARRVKRSMGDLKSSAMALGKAILAAFAVRQVARFGTAVFKAAASFDAMKRGLAAIIPAGEDVTKIMTELKELAKEPGLGFREAVEGYTRLRAVGFAGKEAKDILRELGNSVALVGGGRAELFQAVDAISKMGAEGKITQERINQLALNMPTLSTIMKETFGTATAEGIRGLGIGVEEFTNRLIDGMSEQARASGGAQNALENLGDAFDQLKIMIGDQFAPAATKAIESITEAMEGLDVSIDGVEQGMEKLTKKAGMPALFDLGKKIGEAISPVEDLGPISPEEVSRARSGASGKRATSGLMRSFEEEEKRAHDIRMAAFRREQLSESLNFSARAPGTDGAAAEQAITSLSKLSMLADAVLPKGQQRYAVAPGESSSLAKVGGGGNIGPDRLVALDKQVVSLQKIVENTAQTTTAIENLETGLA